MCGDQDLPKGIPRHSTTATLLEARSHGMIAGMKYRRFGRTELPMPVISCGGMRYQHKWEDIDPKDVPKANQDNLETIIHRALELGINHLETARGYGSSEMQLGRVLPTVPRDKIIVQTKVRPFATQREFFNTFERSMKYLRLDYVDLLALHGVNDRQLLDWSLRKGGCLEAMRQLQRDGRCRFVGFSTHATTDIILEAVRSDGFDYVNLHWYFVNDLNWPALEAARARDMGVFIISPNDKGGKLYAPPKKLADLCAPLSPMQFNDLYCLVRPQVHTLSCGVTRPEDFDEHIAALAYYDRIPETIIPIEKRLRDELRHVLGEHLQRLSTGQLSGSTSGRHLQAESGQDLQTSVAASLGEKWLNHWHEGLPHYVDVPGEINVTEILRLWTYAKGLDLVDWGKMRYNLLGGQAGDWFPGQLAAQVQEQEILKLMRRHPFAAHIPALLREAHALLFDQPVQRLSQQKD